MKTKTQLISCVKRELSLRVAVYPRRVADNRMGQQQADHEIECMREILALLEAGQPQEPNQPLLFNEPDNTKPEKTP